MTYELQHLHHALLCQDHVPLFCSPACLHEIGRMHMKHSKRTLSVTLFNGNVLKFHQKPQSMERKCLTFMGRDPQIKLCVGDGILFHKVTVHRKCDTFLQYYVKSIH